MKKRIGVYICHCGGNISDYVDVKKVMKSVENEEGVVLAKTTVFACSDSSQKEMVQDILENKLDGMVVASCSPKLHLHTFRSVAERAGINPYEYIQVNIREQGSWAHSDKPEEATEKAIRLVRSGVRRAVQAKPLIPNDISVTNGVAIIGGGAAGMRAAIELADTGLNVYLIEKEHFLGGRISQWGNLFESEERGEEIVERLYNEIRKRSNIKIWTGAEVESFSGCVGNFELEVKIHPRYVKTDKECKKFDEIIKQCPVEVPDEFNFGLTKRKAIYKTYEKAFPQTPAIDIKNCTKCGICEQVCPEAFDFNGKEEKLNLKIGAVILTTGFSPYEPKEGEYGYKNSDNVLTLQQFRRLVELSNGKLVFNDKEINNIVFIYCVGSRQKEGDNKYCSRFCCTAAIHTSLLLKEKYKDIKTYHLFRDIRTYGKQELLYRDSCKNGDIYLKFDENQPPEVLAEGKNSVVRIKDLLTEGEEIEINPDLIVLVTGMIPRNNEKLEKIFKVPIGRDRFFNEIHPKLRPVETVIDGVFIAGTSQGPKNLTESILSSLSSSAKTYSLLSGGTLQLEPIVAIVDENRCEWCGKCEEVCIYDAIEKKEVQGKTIAYVNEALCKGCGSCIPVCEPRAIELKGYTNKEIMGMIDGIMEEVNG
jgi:heterodisulfide reductase subunit A